MAEPYDGFTFLTLAWLEALGFCGDGESGPFMEGATRIALDGELPLNTYGGQLSAGRMHGYWLLHEACVQLRGEAGERQVRCRPEVALVAAGGGPIPGCILLTGRPPAPPLGLGLPLVGPGGARQLVTVCCERECERTPTDQEDHLSG